MNTILRQLVVLVICGMAAAQSNLTVSKTSQTITFAALPSQTMGNNPLTLSATSSSGLAVSLSSSNPAVATLSGNTLTLVGSGTTTITANQAGNSSYDPAPTVTRLLTVNPGAPSLAITPNPLAISVRSGETASVPAQLSNPTTGAVDWNLKFPDANGRSNNLEAALAMIDASGTALNGPLPTRVDFTEGETGTYLSSSALSSFSQSNQLTTNLGGPLVYSNDVVASSTVLGTGGRYFTRKLPGLFIFAADLNGVSWFEIAGSIPYGQSRTTSAFQILRNGKQWSAFAAKSVDFWRTINHLILVDQSGLTQTIGTSATDEKHRISGLSGNRRIYHLLFVTSTTTVQPDTVFQDLANRLLDNVPSPFATALGVTPATGNTSASTTTSLTATANAIGLSPGTLAGKLTAISPSGSQLASVPVSLEVTAPRLALPASINQAMVTGLVATTVTMPITSNLPDAQSWSASLPGAPAWLSLVAASGTTPDPLQLRFDPGTLAAGSYSTLLHIVSGPATFDIPVVLQVNALTLTKIFPDPSRPLIYAINIPDSGPGSLLVIDSLTHSITRSIPLGSHPTDCDISADRQSLFVIDSWDKTISVVDLTSFATTATYALTAYTDWGSTVTHAHVRAGKGDILYYVDGQWGPRLRVFNRATGLVLQTFGASTSGTNNDDGIGGLALTPDGTMLFTWEQYGWSAGSSGTYISKFRVNADGTLAYVSKTTATGSTNFARDPLDTPAMVTIDGTRLVVKDRAFLTADAGGNPVIYPDETYSISLNGEIAASASAIYAGRTGASLYTLPVTAPVQAITPDYSTMVYFNPSARSLAWLDLISTLGTNAIGLATQPADGATVAQPSQLRWLPVKGILRYQVYFGTSRSEVEGATPASANYLGETTSPWFNLTTPLTPGQGFYWRVVPITADGQATGPGTTRAFAVSNLTVSRNAIEGATVAGVPRHLESISLQSASPQTWSVSSDVSWIRFAATSGTTPGNLTAVLDASALASGFQQGNITVTSGGSSFVIPVSLRVYAANYMIAKADPRLPCVYVISQENNNSNQPSFLLRVNTVTNQIEADVPCGQSVTDMSIHDQENRIYLTNWQTGTLRAFDRATLQEVQTYGFNPPGGTGANGGDAYVAAAGRAGRLILEQKDQWINFFLIDTATGNKLATGHTCEGGGVFDPAGRYYYHGEDNNSGAALDKFDTNSDILSQVASRRVFGYSSYGSRLVAMSADGSRVFWNGGVFDANLNVLMQLDEEVVASTCHGEVIFTNTKAINGVSSQTLATLPVNTKVQAVSYDQKKLYLFPANSQTFTVVDLSAIASLPPRGLVPGIADGATVIGTAQELSWLQEPAALSYDVYFGTSAAAVTSATKTSAEYLGTVTGTKWTGALPALMPGSGYYWRVDINGFYSVTKGSTWSFQISTVDVAPRVVSLAAPSGAPVPRQVLALSSSTPVAWRASTSTPWITLRTSSGTTPATLEFDISTTGLSVGAKAGSITLQAAGQTCSVPVNLSIVTLNVTKLIPHPGRAVVYGINTALAGEGFCQLLEIDAATAAIRRTLPIGFATTDADLDPASGRLYISNWGYSPTRVIDVDNWVELPPLSLGTDIYKLEITPDGRLLTEGEDQWVQLDLWNAASGAHLASQSTIREGDGQADPTGKYYYHCDNDNSDATVTKYDISGGTFAQSAVGPQIGYGSRNLILSGDGSRLFWQGAVMDANLRTLSQMPAEVYATNRTGDLAVGAGAVWWSDSGTLVANLPFSSTVTTVSANDAYLVRFNATTLALSSTALSSLTDLPGPWPRPGQMLASSPQRISWSPVAGATAYRIYIAADATALQAMTNPTATVVTTYYDPPSPLNFGCYYTWRVDAVNGGGGVTAGHVQSFGISFPAGPALAQGGSISGSSGIAASIADRHLIVGVSGAAQIYDFNPGTGVTSPLQNFTLPSNSATSYFGNSVAVDAGNAAIGAYGFANPATNGGAAFLYKPGTSGIWQGGGALTPPSPVASEMFGYGLAASGNLMLVGTGNTYSTIGRVAAYVTEPAATRVQVFSAADSVTGDAFGRVIAMDGNRAIISAPGYGSSYSRIPCLYAFARSTATGLWSQTQKISIPGASAEDSSGSSLAISGSIMATRCGYSSVATYTADVSGHWTSMAIISGSTISNSSSSFGTAVALLGDQLFIGDPGASYNGNSGGVVFSFRRAGTTWVAGPVITPADSHSSFGQALAAREGWLLASGGTTQSAWLFRVDASANHIPRFVPGIPFQVVAGRAFSTAIRAEDADGNSGLVMDKLQGPSWLTLTDSGNGSALLSGTPSGNSGDVQEVQLRVRDTAGAQALYTYKLTLLAATDVPIFTQTPTGADLGEGQELTLHAAVSGTGPFQWQWYHNGTPISGANRESYFLGEVALADAGSYSVRVANVVGGAVSTGASVTVHPATPNAGDWPTFGSSPAHTGHHPAALDLYAFKPAWTRAVQSGHSLNRAAIANGSAYVVPNAYFGPVMAAQALDLATGNPLWSFSFPSSCSSNPPSVANGRVYFQRGKGTGDVPQLFCLNAGTGAQIWASTFGAQWESYEAPAVTSQGIFINGGTYGGMYGFNADGSQLFFQSLAQYDDWTPTIASDRLFSWVAGTFTEHNPADGTTIWSVNTGWSWSGWSMNTVSAVSVDTAAVISTTELVCIDIPSRAIRWRTAATFTGSPAISSNRIFAIQGNAVRSYAQADGTPGIVYQTNASSGLPLLGQPVVFNDRLVVSSESNIWVFNLADGKLLQTLSAGGRLSYSNGYLLAAGSDGVMRAFLATPQPRLVVEQPAGSALADGVSVVDPGTPPVGRNSVTEFTIRNTGLADMTGIGISFAGADSADFNLSGAPGSTPLAPGATTTFRITFTSSHAATSSADMLVASNDPDHAPFRIHLVANPPVVLPAAASAITGISATLNGTATANTGDALAVSFQYGMDTTYGNTVDALPTTISGHDPAGLSAAIAGLLPGITYHYLAGVTNAYGTHWGADSTFTTLSDNAWLAGLGLSDGVLTPGFAKTTFGYITTVPFATTAVTVTAATEHPGASVRVNGVPLAGGPINLSVGNNTVTITVTAEDGIATKTYTIIVSRLPESFAFHSTGDIPVTAYGFAPGGQPVNIVLGFRPQPGTVLTLVNNTGLGFLQGTFGNLAQGQPVDLTFDGVTYHFIANYYGGTGNDLVLQWASQNIYSWGLNNCGQLGDNSLLSCSLPTAITHAGALADQTVLALATGGTHSLALCADGTVAAWGDNRVGQLGNNGTTNCGLPVPVVTTGALAGKTVVAIAAGESHCLALCSDGTVAAWGDNSYGELGNRGYSNSSVPVAVDTTGGLTGKSVVAIAAGRLHSLALCSDGSLFAWGHNGYGELGNGSIVSSNVPVAVGTFGTSSGMIVKAISAGVYHNLALCADGNLYAWGSNYSGELGDGSTVDRAVPTAVVTSDVLSGKTITAIAAGSSHSLALCADGTLAAWGYNLDGEFGDNSATGSTVPVNVTNTGSLSGNVITAITAGDHSFALCSVGALVSWGRNNNGQLGDGCTSNINCPTAVSTTAFGAGEIFTAIGTGPTAKHALALTAVPVSAGASTSSVPGVPRGAAADNTYEKWKTVVFANVTDPNAPAIVAETATPAHDGISNLMKYAMALDPLACCADRMPTMSQQDGYLTLTYRMSKTAGDVTYTVQASDSLAGALWSPATTVISQSDQGDYWLVTVRDTVPVTGRQHRFMRLQVSK